MYIELTVRTLFYEWTTLPVPTQRIIKSWGREGLQKSSDLTPVFVKKNHGKEKYLVSLKGTYVYHGIVIFLPNSVNFKQ